MFRVRSSNEPLVILDAPREMQEILKEVERGAVEEAREQALLGRGGCGVTC